MAADVFALSAYFMGGILNFLLVILTIALFVKLFFAIAATTGVKGPWSRKSRSGGGDDDPSGRGGRGGSGGGDDDAKTKKKQDEMDEFEDGIENPAFIKIWVRNRDGQAVKGALVDIVPSKKSFFSRNKNKRRWKILNQETNANGVFPGHDYLRVPSGIPIKLEVNYILARSMKYRTQKRGIFSLGLGKRRWFNPPPQILTFNAGDHQEVEFVLAFDAEAVLGFEPHVESVDYASTPGRIKTKAIVNSPTGRIR